MNTIRTGFSIVLMLAAGVMPGVAHHSHAMFDHTVEVTVTGTVTNFSFRNPHVFLYLDVEGEDGEIVGWAIEMSNINNTIRAGIGGGTFEPGDVLTVTMNPLKNGEPGGNFTQIVADDGSRYPS